MSLRLHVREALRSALHRAGFDLVRVLEKDHLLKQAVQVMGERHIGVVLDVGANTGQWARTIRALGYGGDIISFEPLSDAYRSLQTEARRDNRWTPINLGLDEHPGEVVIHVSANSQSSSMLDMLPLHREAAPGSVYTRDETVRTTTLENVLTEDFPNGGPVFVKVDAQGYEHRVLNGARGVIDRVVALQVELSLVALYEGELLIEDMLASLRRLGYVPTSFEPNFWSNETGRLLQVDGLFIRS